MSQIPASRNLQMKNRFIVFARTAQVKLIVFIAAIVNNYHPLDTTWRPQEGGHRPDDSMEIDQIETFLAVAAYGGFHRAAAALRMSQPAVSARIKALEQSLGVSLFTRAPGGLELSPAGRALKPYAEQLLQAATMARQAIQELNPGGKGGTLQI